MVLVTGYFPYPHARGEATDFVSARSVFDPNSAHNLIPLLKKEKHFSLDCCAMPSLNYAQTQEGIPDAASTKSLRSLKS